MPRVTVIVAARDAAATLTETLASILAQTSPEWDVVLVDDASCDGTGDLADEILGDRVRVLRNDSALGPAGARNLGARHASTELLATLDADDVWEPELLEHQLGAYDRALAEGRRVGLITCNARMRRGHGELEPDTWADRVQAPERVTLDSLLVENTVFTSVLVPSAVFRELGGYAEDLVHGEDFDLWLRIAERGYEILSTPRTLAVYRLRPDGLSGDTARMSESTAGIYTRALERGALDRGQRRLARRQRRLQRLIARRARVAAAAAGGRDVRRERLALVPVTMLVALEHPERWAHWLRSGPRDPGPARHAS